MEGFQFSDISYLAERKTLDPFSRRPGRKSNLHKDKENSCHLFPDSHGERDKFGARVKKEKKPITLGVKAVPELETVPSLFSWCRARTSGRQRKGNLPSSDVVFHFWAQKHLPVVTWLRP